ncbi:MAG: hypothetical protein AA931_04375 [Peptococcaceae bacterium 1109]|nr:MAG: hypothetical protein AA931_04375 [Peptococcaceae bacterium 1109]
MFSRALGYVGEFVTQRNASGAVAVMGSAHEMWGPYAFGHLSFFPGADPVLPDSLFDLASLTKVISTTTIALRLIEEGKLSLEQCIGDFAPWAPPEKHPITIQQLLSHTSGFPATAPLYESPHFHSGEGALAAALALPLSYQPGTAVEYSCIGFITLGRIIEQIAGKTLDRLFEEFVAQPLELEDTSYGVPPSKLARTAYTEWDPVEKRFIRGVVHDENARSLKGISGNAGLFSTGAELGKFCQMLLGRGSWDGQHVLRPETVDLLARDFTGSEEEPRTLGWLLPSPRRCSGGKLVSKHAIGHTGFTGTSIWIDFTRNLFAVLLTNRVHPVRANLAILRLRPRFYNAVWQAYDEKTGA